MHAQIQRALEDFLSVMIKGVMSQIEPNVDQGMEWFEIPSSKIVWL
jgi:hypothetical protein